MAEKWCLDYGCLNYEDVYLISKFGKIIRRWQESKNIRRIKNENLKI